MTGYVADTVRVRRALSAGGWEGCIFFRIRKFFICLHTFSHVDPQKINSRWLLLFQISSKKLLL